jgi:hypothetical protein
MISSLPLYGTSAGESNDDSDYCGSQGCYLRVLNSVEEFRTIAMRSIGNSHLIIWGCFHFFNVGEIGLLCLTASCTIALLWSITETQHSADLGYICNITLTATIC